MNNSNKGIKGLLMGILRPFNEQAHQMKRSVLISPLPFVLAPTHDGFRSELIVKTWHSPQSGGRGRQGGNYFQPMEQLSDTLLN